MTVYVDDAMIPWNPRHYKGQTWLMSHLFADTDAELHAFAARIGLKRAWHQCPPKASWSHYDVSAAKRKQALSQGAVSIGKREVPQKWTQIETARLLSGPFYT